MLGLAGTAGLRTCDRSPVIPRRDRVSASADLRCRVSAGIGRSPTLLEGVDASGRRADPCTQLAGLGPARHAPIGNGPVFVQLQLLLSAFARRRLFWSATFSKSGAISLSFLIRPRRSYPLLSCPLCNLNRATRAISPFSSSEVR